MWFLVYAIFNLCWVTILNRPKRKIARDVAREATLSLKYSSITKSCQGKYVNNQDFLSVLFWLIDRYLSALKMKLVWPALGQFDLLKKKKTVIIRRS